ncbi:YceI family protein [Aureliella helgolandensis]|uniref:Lipid/polyisoprenoid-binding YceI-like domain-containing protein n=1 Tax=Aureliella helgolandensis TaxID=2527968 RepID=A0A518G140_9BACT|nr:YceI family protein [Aureliella helgolandensis]QDV22319.1 hypothetical protein Q31a_06030 [Aureliella helgolandensis]
MRLLLATLLILPFSLGCNDSAVPELSTASSGTTVTPETSPSPEPAAAGGIQLTPDNTTIAFVGSHVSEEQPDPKARHGKFKKFVGSATVTDGKLVALQLEIETSSLDTEIDDLNSHLKNADFFDVNEHPKAKFTSTSIEETEDGKATITGDLELLKAKKSITFPATLNTAEGLELSADFVIDRTEFGMTYGEGKVEKEVAMSVNVSAK